MSILHDDDILDLAGYKIRNNELKAAKKDISFILIDQVTIQAS